MAVNCSSWAMPNFEVEVPVSQPAAAPSSTVFQLPTDAIDKWIWNMCLSGELVKDRMISLRALGLDPISSNLSNRGRVLHDRV